jgi:hypothetical protein
MKINDCALKTVNASNKRVAEALAREPIERPCEDPCGQELFVVKKDSSMTKKPKKAETDVDEHICTVIGSVAAISDIKRKIVDITRGMDRVYRTNSETKTWKMVESFTKGLIDFEKLYLQSASKYLKRYKPTQATVDYTEVTPTTKTIKVKKCCGNYKRK